MSVKRSMKKDRETASPETGKKDLETAASETLRPGGILRQGYGAQGQRPKKKKKMPVPKCAVWWSRAEGHPMLNFFGAELKSQRDEKRGWTLEDLHEATGLSKSFLSDLEHGKSKPTEEVILELEAGFGMKPGALIGLTHRRWKRELKKPGMMESLMQQIRQVRRAWRRDAFAAWLGGLLPLKLGMAWEEAAG